MSGRVTLRGALAALGLGLGPDELEGRWGLRDTDSVNLSALAARAAVEENRLAAEAAEEAELLGSPVPSEKVAIVPGDGSTEEVGLGAVTPEPARVGTSRHPIPQTQEVTP